MNRPFTIKLVAEYHVNICDDLYVAVPVPAEIKGHTSSLTTIPYIARTACDLMRETYPRTYIESIRAVDIKEPDGSTFGLKVPKGYRKEDV